MIDLNEAIKSQAQTWEPLGEILWRALAGAPPFLRRICVGANHTQIIFKDIRDGKQYAISIKELT